MPSSEHRTLIMLASAGVLSAMVTGVLSAEMPRTGSNAGYAVGTTWLASHNGGSKHSFETASPGEVAYPRMVCNFDGYTEVAESLEEDHNEGMNKTPGVLREQLRNGECRFKNPVEGLVVVYVSEVYMTNVGPKYAVEFEGDRWTIFPEPPGRASLKPVAI